MLLTASAVDVLQLATVDLLGSLLLYPDRCFSQEEHAPFLAETRCLHTLQPPAAGFLSAAKCTYALSVGKCTNALG